VFRVTQSRLVGIALVGNMASAFWVLMFSYLFSKREVYPCFLWSGSSVFFPNFLQYRQTSFIESPLCQR